ncbi:MAG: uracil phosphoribosyltransferase [Candidatus Magasanikbacteria bacterium]|nr:uracil phosphoribosyltransferase [Candidatus Magasanikbacteria bacterium]
MTQIKKGIKLIQVPFIDSSQMLRVFLYNFNAEVTSMRKVFHRYGPNVRVLSDPMANSGLTRLSDKQTGQHDVRGLAAALFREVLLRSVVSEILPTTEVMVATPMTEFIGERGQLVSEITDPSSLVTLATLLRAGDVPASACFSRLSGLLNPSCVRQDFFGAGRVTDEEHRVTGTKVTYQKIGDLQGRFLLIPDPMGATGGTVVETIGLYGEEQIKAAKAIVAMHLIITPEYIRRVLSAYPQVQIFALRLDRGMSDQDVLDSVPGTFPEREFGLTKTQYIAPGAGDLGYRLTGAE